MVIQCAFVQTTNANEQAKQLQFPLKLLIKHQIDDVHAGASMQ